MTRNKGKKVKIKKINEKTYKANYWAAFRQPNNLDKIIFDDPWSSPWIRQPGWRGIWPELWFGGKAKEIPVELKESQKKYQVFAAMPDVLKENIDVQIASKDIAIRGDLKLPKNKEDSEQEKEHSTLVRSISFSDEVNSDNTEAFLKDGILQIIVPKKKMTMDQAGRKIEIKQDKRRS
jgi:HSP20 family protein